MISALSASGKYDAAALFVEYYGNSPTVADDSSQENADDSEIDFDYSGVKWDLPSDGDKDALADLAQVMSANGTMSLTGDIDEKDLDLTVDLTPQDREWL